MTRDEHIRDRPFLPRNYYIAHFQWKDENRFLTKDLKNYVDKKKDIIFTKPKLYFVFILSFEMENLCITCKVDMGESNPRQFCGKTRCDNEYLYLDQEENDEEALLKKQKLKRRLEPLYKKRQAWLDLIRKHEMWLVVLRKHEELYSPLEESQAEMVLEAFHLSLAECEAKIITIEES